MENDPLTEYWKAVDGCRKAEREAYNTFVTVIDPNFELPASFGMKVQAAIEGDSPQEPTQNEKEKA